MLQIVDAAVEQLTKQEVWERRGFPGLAPGRTDQDAAGCFAAEGIFAVADGIASRPHSKLAATALVSTFVNAMRRHGLPTTAKQASERIQDGLIDDMQLAAARTEGASTLTAMIITPDRHMTYLNAGDSQLLIRRPAHILRQTSEQGLKARREGEVYGLYNFFGMVDGYDPAVPPRQLTENPNSPSVSGGTEWGSVPLLPGDRLILVTDGVLGDKEDERLGDAAWLGFTRRTLGAHVCAKLLVRHSYKLDDRTAIVVNVDDAISE